MVPNEFLSVIVKNICWFWSYTEGFAVVYLLFFFFRIVVVDVEGGFFCSCVFSQFILVYYDLVWNVNDPTLYDIIAPTVLHTYSKAGH